MSHPPTFFDIANRWAQADRPLTAISAVANALRGTHYPTDLIRVPSPNVIDVSTSRLHVREDELKSLVVLGNLQVREEWAWAAANGRPVASRARVNSLARVLNGALDLARRSRRNVMLVLPELALPRRWLRALVDRLVEARISVTAGLEYRVVGTDEVVNEAVGVFATDYHFSAVAYWTKTRPARHEAQELHEKANRRLRPQEPRSLVVNADAAAMSVLICSELLDVELRAGLLGRIDLLLVPAWNQDTATFEHTIQTTSNDLHCYVAVANNAAYSDCRIQAPSENRYERDLCRLISRHRDQVIGAEMDASLLRLFQQTSLDDPNSNPKGFKPIPPGFRYRRP